MSDGNIAIDLTNRALLKLGEKTITSFEEKGPTAEACKRLYPGCRDALLSWQAWPFATVRQELVQLAATPPADFAHYFLLPTMPRVYRVMDNALESRLVPYQREIYVNPDDPTDQREVLASDAERFILRYVGQTSEAVWSPLFLETLSTYLAYALAMTITGKPSLKEILYREVYDPQTGCLTVLRHVTGYEDDPRQIPHSDAYLGVRGGWWEGAPMRLGGW